MGAERYARWFDTGQGMWPVHRGNVVNVYVTGEEAFDDIGDLLQYEARPGAQAYLLGWSFDFNIAMSAAGATPPRMLGELLKNFSKEGGSVRAMLWDNTLMKGAGTTEGVDFVRALPRGRAILDRRTPLFGTHHQKLQAIVSGDQGPVKSLLVSKAEPLEAGVPVAFTGGMDLFRDRVGEKTLHDVHCKVVGPAATDLVRVFLERWNDHPDRGESLVPQLHSVPASDGDLVQVCRTYPRFENSTVYAWLLDRYGGVLKNLAKLDKRIPSPGDMQVDGNTRYYDFYDHSAGVQQVWRAVRKVIAEARSYIYFEDQYLTNKWVGDALAAKLAAAGPDFRIVGLALHPDENTDTQQVWPRRRDLLTGLKKVDPRQRRWRVFSRPGKYIHSKTWIVDDEVLIIGSANADRRGYTYNSEAGIVAAGDLGGRRQSAFGATTLAQDARCRLFAQHLGGSAHSYLDPRQGLTRWFEATGRGRVVPFDAWAKEGPPDAILETLREISARNPPLAGLLSLMDMAGGAEKILWDIAEDPDAWVPPP